MDKQMNIEEIGLIEVGPENIEEQHICCAIGNDKTNKSRALQKKDWLKERFSRGHRFVKADIRGKVFIEYGPAEESIFPVEAPGYAVIQCYWVSGRFKGQGLGRKLFDFCLKDCKARGYKGLAAVVSDKKRPFMVDKKVLLHYGFTTCDQAPPYYELISLKIDEEAGDPRFMDSARRGAIKDREGLDFFYSAACPFNHDFTHIMADIGREMGFPVRIHPLKTREDLKALPTPWGLFSLFLNGEPLAAEVMTANKFRQLLEKSGK